MLRQHQTRINDLTAVGQELADEHLAIASGAAGRVERTWIHGFGGRTWSRTGGAYYPDWEPDAIA